MIGRVPIPRNLQSLLIEKMGHSPVNLIHGPRQCGKTTLAQSVGDRLDEMLDEQCVNPCYSGMTMREIVSKVVLRRDDPMDDSISESEKIERE